MEAISNFNLVIEIFTIIIIPACYSTDAFNKTCYENDLLTQS